MKQPNDYLPQAEKIATFYFPGEDSASLDNRYDLQEMIMWALYHAADDAYLDGKMAGLDRAQEIQNEVFNSRYMKGN